MRKHKQLSVNLIAQALAFIVNFAINFFLTPYIIERVGREAYGFVSLGNNFVNYGLLISLALNSMASRFISISINKDDFQSAKQYYTSVIVSNIILASFLSVPSVLIVLNLNKLVSVSVDVFADVQILWMFLFINFLIDIVTSTFATALFAANRVDIQAKRNIISYILRAVILIGMYVVLPTKVWYIGFASVICTVYAAIANLITSRKLYPQLRVKKDSFSFSKVKQLLASGIWNSISRVGSIALTELDLLLSNLFINAEAMGTLAIAKMVPTTITSFINTIITVFVPSLTISYATKDNDKIIKEVKNYIRMLIFFQTIVYGALFGYLEVFYKLWLPDRMQDTSFIYIVSIITILDCLVSPVSNIMFNIFTVTNKIRFSSIVVIITGAVSICVTYLALSFTNMGLFAIAGISVSLCTVRNLFILIPYGAKCLNKPWYTFYPEVGLNILSLVVSITIAFVVKAIVLSSKASWILLSVSVITSSLITIFINGFLVLKKDERALLVERIISKVRKGK